MGDMCGHGGTIVVGQPNVLIGEISPAVSVVTPAVIANIIMVEKYAGEVAKGAPPAVQESLSQVGNVAKQILTVQMAAQQGAPFCEICAKAGYAG
jgi:hypothetical protein